MGQLTLDHRHDRYRQEAARTGIHKPILAALHQVQQQPVLPTGETGLGIAPANRVPLAAVSSFTTQVQYAANTLRSLIDRLIADGWQGKDLWQADQGRYSDQLVAAIADGYTAPNNDPNAALLEASDKAALLQAYLMELATDWQTLTVPATLAYLDEALLAFVESLSHHYVGLPNQRDALLELVRLWRKLDTRAAAIASLQAALPTIAPAEQLDAAFLDTVLLQFVQRVAPNYAAYPYQREALLYLLQHWRQLDSREAAIVSLAADRSPALPESAIDPALIALMQRIPAAYEGKGEQRHALVEGFRLWQQLDSRSATLIALGVDPDLFVATAPDQTAIVNAAVQLDRALLDFIQRVPVIYTGSAAQREALLHIAQLWRATPTPAQTTQSLLSDLKRLDTARRDTPDAAPPPTPLLLPPRPDHWTPDTIQFFAAIVPNGSFTWADATRGGKYMPPHQAVVDAIVRIAALAQQARDRLGRPCVVTCWYHPGGAADRATVGASSRHRLGDAIDLYCDGLTGEQIYWFLAPWWPGGLGRFASFPYLIHLDARPYRARWVRSSAVATPNMS